MTISKERHNYKRTWYKDKYQNDPEYRKEEQKRCRENKHKLYIKNKEKAIEYTGGKPCHNPKCNHNPEFLSHIEFHHVISENKTNGFGYLFKTCKWETIKEEIDNCKAIPLCALCHRDITCTTWTKPLNTHEELE